MNEDDLRQARRAEALAVLRDAVVLLDAQLSVLDHNGVLTEILGLRPGTPVDLLALAHPDDAEQLAALLAEARTAHPARWAQTALVRLRHADGTHRALSVEARGAAGRVAGVEVVVQARPLGDVVRPVAPPAVDDDGSVPTAAELLHEVVANTPVALITLDPDGVVRFAAGAALTADPAQLVGRALTDLAENEEQAEHMRRALTGEDVTMVSLWSGRHWQAKYRPLWRDGVVGGTLTGVAAVFTDITALTVAQHARAALDSQLRGILDAVPEALVVMGADRRVLWANDASSRLFARRIEPGTTVPELVGEANAAELAERLDRRESGQAERYELRVVDAHGAVRWLYVSGSPLLDDDGRFLGAVGLLRDITDSKLAERRLQAVALTDTVTGVANRVSLGDRLAQALRRREAGLVALLFVDVDSLKAFNDTRGHAAGDALLRHVAQQAAGVLRPEDTIARYGGDEFVAVCTGLHDAIEVLQLAERIREAVSEPLQIGADAVRPSVSIGVATSPPFTDADALLSAADAAAYEAKRAGRNAVRLAPGP